MGLILYHFITVNSLIKRRNTACVGMLNANVKQHDNWANSVYDPTTVV